MIKELNLAEKFAKISEHWTPKIIAELNGQYIKLAKIKGEFVWHSHQNEDELFQVIKGTLIVEFKDKITYTKKGEILIIPKGVEHKPKTNGEEVWIMLFEPKSTKHTGEIVAELTVEKPEWIWKKLTNEDM